MLAFDAACPACYSPCKHPGIGANRREWEQIGGNGSKQAGMGANMQQWGHTGGNGSKQAGTGADRRESDHHLQLLTQQRPESCPPVIYCNVARHGHSAHLLSNLPDTLTVEALMAWRVLSSSASTESATDCRC